MNLINILDIHSQEDAATQDLHPILRGQRTQVGKPSVGPSGIREAGCWLGALEDSVAGPQQVRNMELPGDPGIPLLGIYLGMSLEK